MKRMITLLFLMTMLCTMPAAAMTSTLELHADKDRLGEKEQIAVTVYLYETVTGEFRNLQGQLTYDTEIFSYVSHQMGEAYSQYAAADMAEKGFFTFSNTDFTDKGFSEIQEGTLVTVVFETKEKLKRKERDTKFVLNMDLQDTRGVSETFAKEVSIKVSGKNNAGQSEADQTDMDHAAGEAVENPAKEDAAGQSSEPRNLETGIVIMGAGFALVWLLYRIWSRKKEKRT
ncbi:MAG: hypothetical protein IKJ77_08430 [Firmicutes bacterium]|nr:hypothetical protein [Bacillota bacterium]